MKHVSTAGFQHAEGERLIDFWRGEFVEHETPADEPEPGLLIADTGFVRVTVRVAGQDCRIEIASHDESVLPEFRTGISQHMEAFDPELPPLAWSGADRTGALPPTLAIGQVCGCEPVGGSWWRMSVRLSAEGHDRFASTAHWHFRLLRPALTGRAPVWPRLDAHGVIRWPDGADTLTDRVFTISASDPGAQTVTFDIFRHPGGPTCDWAETRPLGQTVGLMGPGARGGPEAVAENDALLVGGDETSAPAILRGLEEMPQGTRVEVYLLVGSPDDVQPVAPSGLKVNWLFRSLGATEDTLTERIRDRLSADRKPSGLWFAASRQAARLVKDHAVREAGLAKATVHSVAYWS